ncbi:hypothetical protein BOTBODRAFT_173388 [Botryobasidium botryosum FD-172 SS1]|uniref:Uncharacterized protein n=1 Tax=Botryobasidium botryosum (strain FD-172 SS1) TaxID=930990 RepID=A0A067MKM6_BOTB1|nr:hypothetical protein BOTBODRAFT_173388 [Botryobasidium botryosum FD-172 SS1]
MASLDPRDHYKIDRATVDVEALAQRQARYLKIHAEEAHWHRRVARLGYAVSAFTVFVEYKVNLALRHHPDLMNKVDVRAYQIFDDWARGDFARKFDLRIPPSVAASPTTQRLPSSLKRIKPADISRLIKNPRSMLDMKFFHNVGRSKGVWKLQSFQPNKSGGVEYKVEFERAFPVSLDEKGIRLFLTRSRISR